MNTLLEYVKIYGPAALALLVFVAIHIYPLFLLSFILGYHFESIKIKGYGVDSLIWLGGLPVVLGLMFFGGYARPFLDFARDYFSSFLFILTVAVLSAVMGGLSVLYDRKSKSRGKVD